MPPDDKLLFTPGPLTTSPGVKHAMLRDLGSRDDEFVRLVGQVRTELVRIAGGDLAEWTCVPVQGSGTFAVEATLTTLVPRSGELLVLENGAYGTRMVRIAQCYGIRVRREVWPEDRPVDPEKLARTLERAPAIGHVALVHCETTTGIANPLSDVAEVVACAGRRLLVDAMSSFGVMPLDVSRAPLEGQLDAVVSSANKGLQGVPGVAFVLCRRTALEAARGNARSLALDLEDQHAELERSGQFRFTPPTHVVLALHQALRELATEGGVAARGARCARHQRAIARGFAELGFVPLLAPELQSPVITTFRYPTGGWFSFDRLYAELARHGFLLYPGKLGEVDCFRVGSVGYLTDEDVDALIAAAGEVVAAMHTRAALERL